MDLANLLPPLTTLPALRGLLHALGQTPAWEELPPGALPDWPGPAALVGRAGNFEWLALEAAGPAIPRRVSAALARRGRIAAVLALDPQAGALTLAVTVDRTASRTIPTAAPRPADLDCLARLAALPRESGIALALRTLEVLSGEDAGRRFFLAFREVTGRMAAALPGRLTPEDRQTLALVQLTRVLFLYFVQAKGWLDGQPDFLRRAVDDALARGRQLHRDLFRPLFFGTLNRPVDARGRARGFGRIPFLNGGLFEAHPLERRWRGEVPTAEWRDAFDQLFERFRFTVHEGAEPGQIAPDMLGRVFEGLMAPATRRAAGAFYTPAPLVGRVVDAALHAWVSGRLGCSREAAASRLAERDPPALALLPEITLLDPAAGSGAFLLGALERLAELQAGAAPPALLRRRIVGRNLFGVDRHPMAVRLAELRLWLAIIAWEAAPVPEQVAPLPNLDGVVRAGDSLLDPAGSVAALGGLRAGAAPDHLGPLRRAFTAASGGEKRELARRLRQAEVAAFGDCLTRALSVTERALAEVLGAAREQTLFGDRRGCDRALAVRLHRLRRRHRELRTLARQLRREGVAPWFLYECHFADILAQGGFDLVLGNPPWVRAEEIPERERAALAARYRWWRVGGRGFRHLPDLSVAFAERALELLAPGGTLALLLPAKLATAGYGARCRAGLAGSTTLQLVADLRHDPAACFEATTYPAVVIATRGRPEPSHRVALTLDPGGPEVPQARLAGGGPWSLTGPAAGELAVRLAARHPTLGEHFTPQLGVKTGANQVFLDPPADLEPALVVTALRGRDIRPWRPRPGPRLFFPCDAGGAPCPRLPARAAAYVRGHEALLRARVDYRDGPPWTLFRVRPALAPCRVVWADLSRQLNAAALLGPGSGRLIPLNSCYLIALSDPRAALALTAWLNSTWIRALARAVADVAAGEFSRFNARVVAGLPLPSGALADAALARLAEQGARGQPVQEKVDDLVARHLSLSPADCAVLAAGPAALARHRGRGPGRSG